jgi:ketosteroid isomerase-like protein
MSTTDELRELDRAWVRAEIDADVPALAALATDDFVLVGPAGFALDKAAWLGRYAGGDLHTHTLSFQDPQTRIYSEAAVSVGRFVQRAEYRGRTVDGEFRATRIAVRDSSGWRVGGLHLSPIAAMPPAGAGAGGGAGAGPERGR